MPCRFALEVLQQPDDQAWRQPVLAEAGEGLEPQALDVDLPAGRQERGQLLGIAQGHRQPLDIVVGVRVQALENLNQVVRAMDDQHPLDVAFVTEVDAAVDDDRPPVVERHALPRCKLGHPFLLCRRPARGVEGVAQAARHGQRAFEWVLLALLRAALPADIQNSSVTRNEPPTSRTPIRLR